MKLRKLSPVLFAGRRPVPMAIGIYTAIVERLGLTDKDDLAALGIVLRNVVRAEPYLRALITAGAMRHGIDGEAVEAVSDAHREQAKAALAALRSKAKAGKVAKLASAAVPQRSPIVLQRPSV
jgi:sRNA-binding protein